MSYYLMLDDIRSMADVRKYTKLPDVPNEQWIIVRSYDELVDTVSKRGLPTFVSLDHDLASCHYGDGLYDGAIDYAKYTEKTGYDCAKWLVSECQKLGVKHPDYLVHSMNPVGKDNIISYVESYNKSL